MFGPIAVICWYSTWVSAMDVPPKRLVLYYTGNLCLFCCHAKIHKPLKDIIMEIAKRGKLYKQRDQLGEALEDPLKEISKRRVYKRKMDSTVDKDPKRPKV